MIPNLEQRAAIQSDAEVTVVAAGPGSGKSSTLVETVRARVRDGVNPKRIVALTYTNAGAHVYVERLKPLVLGFAGTVHGYGIRLLQAFGGELGYRAGSISIVTKPTQEALLLATAKRLGYARMPKTELFSNSTPQSQLCWNEYRHELKRSNMLDYDMILVETLRLLRSNICEGLDVQQLFVDEAQDSGRIDWDIYEAIPAVRRFYVADADQSCYAFRGGEPSIFVNMAIRHGALTLSKNYRSDVLICEAATNLIRHNRNRIDKPVVAVSKEPGSVTVVEVETDSAEIFKAYQLIRESNVPFNECAVLCRTNALAGKFGTMLRGFGVAVKQSGGMRLPEDWSTALSAIGLLIDPNNNHHAEQLLLKYQSLANIEQLKLKALREQKSLATVGLLPNTTPATLGDGLTMLCTLGISEDSMELIRKRVAVLPNPNPTLSDLLADLWNNDKWNEQDEGDGITVCTVHAFKGKEADFVLVPACEEGIFPHVLTTQKNPPPMQLGERPEVEEERRLFFVAITRARHQLVLTYAKQRTAFNKTTTQEPSRFLTEIQ